MSILLAAVLLEQKLVLGKCKGSIYSYFKRMREESRKGVSMRVRGMNINVLGQFTESIFDLEGISVFSFSR